MNMVRDDDVEAMKQYGFIYADGSYSDERLPKGATLVPRRPGPDWLWDQGRKRWVQRGQNSASEARPQQDPAAKQAAAVVPESPGAPVSAEDVMAGASSALLASLTRTNVDPEVK